MPGFTGLEVCYRSDGALVGACSESMPLAPLSAATVHNVGQTSFVLASPVLPAGVKCVEAQISGDDFASVHTESRSAHHDTICYFNDLNAGSVFKTRFRWISEGGFPSQWGPIGGAETLPDETPPEE